MTGFFHYKLVQLQQHLRFEVPVQHLLQENEYRYRVKNLARNVMFRLDRTVYVERWTVATQVISKRIILYPNTKPCACQLNLIMCTFTKTLGIPPEWHCKGRPAHRAMICFPSKEWSHFELAPRKWADQSSRHVSLARYSTILLCILKIQLLVCQMKIFFFIRFLEDVALGRRNVNAIAIESI
jgi:hypothetical protein